MALDRRRFIRLGGTLALAGGLSASPRRGTKPALRKAVGFGMVAEGATLLEKFQLLADLGFAGIELPSPNGWKREEVLAAREKTGVAISNVVDSVHWTSTLGDADPGVRAKGREALETALRDAQAYGASSVLLVPARVTKEIGYDAAYSRSQAEIRRVLPLAQELGVPIAIENVWNDFLLSPLEAARYVDELASPMARWHMDVGNVVAYGWPEQWIRILGPRIVCLHVKEYSNERRDEEGRWKGFEVELGEGDCDWPAVVDALDEVGYAGWAVAEVGGGDRARLADVGRRMDRILELG